MADQRLPEFAPAAALALADLFPVRRVGDTRDKRATLQLLVDLVPPTYQGLGVWKFRTEIVEPPASGQVRFNNADISSATEMYISETNSGGPTDVSVFMDTLLVLGSIVLVQDKVTAANNVLVECGAVTDEGTYRKIIIASVTENGTEPSNNTDVIVVVQGAGGGGTGLQNIVEDLTPQLGGDLDTNGKNITNLDTTLLDLLIAAGADGAGNGGTLTLRAGASGGSSTKGGSVSIEATNGAGGGAEGGDVSLTAGNASGSGDDGGVFKGMGGNGVGAGGNGGNSVIEAGRSVGGGIGGTGETKGGVGGNGANTGGIGRVIGGVGGDNGGSGGDAEVTGGPGVSAASDGDGGDAVISGGLGAGAGVDGDILLKHGGATQFLVADSPNADFKSLDAGGPVVRNRPTSDTVPTLCPNAGDLGTGVGSGQVGSFSAIADGVEALRLAEANGGILQLPQADLSITAFAGGGQGNLFLKSSYNVLTVVATAGDAVTLPAIHRVNTLVFVKNDGVNAADIFPAAGDDLGLGANIAFSLLAGESISFIGTVLNTTWTPWINTAGVASGVVQTSITVDSAVATGTTTIPIDDTIPQITEGDEFMTVVHTPLDAANILIITVGMYLEGLSRMSIGLFKDAVSDALAATNARGDDGDAKFMHFRTQVVAGGTSAITFRARAGSDGGTTTFNGISGSRIFGGVMASSISVIEVTP